jgi:hypothetical protein
MHHESIREHLEVILSSPAFASSRRCQEFFRYIVNEALEGRAEEIKERNIAVSVFGRDAGYNPAEHSLVRVKAVEVRKRLAKYYEANPASTVRIELATGTYVPVFVIDEPEPLPPPPTRREAGKLALATAVVAAVAAALVLAAFWPRPADPLEQLWAPVLASNRPVLIALPSPKIYQYDMDEPVNASRLITPAELRIMQDYYTGRGAAIGAARFAGLLGARKRPFELKLGQDVSFADLRRQPAILLGAFSSLWTMELTKSLPFRMIEESTANGIVDARDPNRRWMRKRFRKSAEIDDDYAMAARVLDAGSGQVAMIAAGVSAPGTHAAAEFLTTPEYFRQFTEAAGPDWVNKSFQVVVYAQIHGATPGIPKLVAFEVW